MNLKGVKALAATREKTEIYPKFLEELWRCNEVMGLDFFYFVIDLENYELVEKKGLYQNLGYFDIEFSLSTYFDTIPPIQKNAFSAQWHVIINGIDESSLKQKIITLHGMKKKNGEFLYVKRLSMPLGISAIGKINRYLCLFNVIENYESQNFQMRSPTLLHGVEKIQSISYLLPFTHKETELLRAYADDCSLTATRLAERWNVSYNTVLTHKNNAMSKGRKYLALKFPNVSTLAKQLREMRMV